MKLNLRIFYSLFFFSTINICNAQTKIAGKADFADAKHYKTDSVFKNVMIDTNIFNIRVARKSDADESTKKELALSITTADKNKVLLQQYFDQNEYRLFKINNDKLNSTGKLFLEVIFNGGGSGYNGSCFEIASRNDTVKLVPVYNFDELSLLYFSSDNEIIKLEGIWNFKEDESHFSEHRYSVTKINFTNATFKSTGLGNTKFKYEMADGEHALKKLLLLMKKKEPLLLKTLELK
ncbi:hypothetical protein [Ferruginibacter sp. SUN106]|uniref:hypothetical protein n=1 Tax=Ferruginibacter sp. SUN106 TaxID=2978348 RepID=UPI003D36CDDD